MGRKKKKNPTNRSSPAPFPLLFNLSEHQHWRDWIPFISARGGEALLSHFHIMIEDKFKKKKENEKKCFKLGESSGGAAFCQIT